jgi:hypothetical protein
MSILVCAKVSTGLLLPYKFEKSELAKTDDLDHFWAKFSIFTLVKGHLRAIGDTIGPL